MVLMDLIDEYIKFYIFKLYILLTPCCTCSKKVSLE